MKQLVCVLAVLVGFLALSQVSQAAERVVRPGDTLTHIGHLTGHTVQQLVDLNKLANPNHIVIGQRIRYLSKSEDNLYQYLHIIHKFYGMEWVPPQEPARIIFVESWNEFARYD